MTKEEALVFFPLGEQQDLEDAYDQGLFEYKQFFSSKLPVQKLFNAKLSKLEKWDKAFHQLTQQEYQVATLDTAEIESWHFEEDVLVAFSTFQTEKKKLLFGLHACANAGALRLIVLKLLKLHQSYWKLWILQKEEDLEIEQISKEPDPMEVLAAIRRFNALGGNAFSDLYREEFREDVLLKESKRLTLLLNS